MRRVELYLAMLICVLMCSCARQPLDDRLPEPVYQYTPPTRSLSYEDDVKPILTKRCVVCHSCYNSPCQLKLSSWEGFDRGASKEAIYNAQRTWTMEPSRLFVDAESTEEWRQKGFFSIKPDENTSEYEDSIIYMLLDHKRKKPNLLGRCSQEERFRSEDEVKTCAQSTAEVNSYLQTHPNRGMPFGFPPLPQEEFNDVVGWLSQGAQGPTDLERQENKAIPQEDWEWIARWEKLLNTPSPKNLMTARYLYEHLFLAHISFRDRSEQTEPETYRFYELVRSSTPPGEPIRIIATRRPYDDPGSPHTFYRFRKIHSVIVHKTHMLFHMDQRQWDSVNRLFIDADWGVEQIVTKGYDKVMSANPFEVFDQIPVRSRYEWLLDNARYVIMTFIRGPVCKGQVALNVVNDQFWLLFMDPDSDLSIQEPEYFRDQYPNLRMPAEQGSMLLLFKSLFKFIDYKRWSHDYYVTRQNEYASKYPDGLGFDDIWPGEHEDDQPVLTVFRHFDSASVHRGALGKLPKTAWVMDYPIMERIYYALVAGFDVFGALGHQLSTRRYMDALRIEAESSFLQFMPEKERQPMMDYWYQGKLQGKLNYVKTMMPADFPFKAGHDPKRQFLEAVIRDHIVTKDIKTDYNYLEEGESTPALPTSYENMQDYIDGFKAVASVDSSFFRHVHNSNANVGWVRIKTDDGKDKVVSIVVDRWHDNVKCIYGEEKNLDPKKDRADFIEGFVSSYPNYFFEVSVPEMPEFYDALFHYDGSEEAVCRLEKFGINRAEEKFWETADWFLDRYIEELKEEAGVFDLNRYYSLAMRPELYKGGSRKSCNQRFGKRD